MDLDILAVMGLRDNYDKYSRFVQPSSLTEESWNIFSAMGEYFKNNRKAEQIEWNAFKAWLSLVRYAKMDKAKLQAIKDVVDVLSSYKVDDSNMEALLSGLAKRDYATQIADFALRIADGDYSKELDEIDELLFAYNQFIGKVGSVEEIYGEFSLEDLQSVTDPGLMWRMKCLREACGDVRPGDMVVFGKRPDTGGTTFMASEISYMAEQLEDDLSVAWFNNEEKGSKVRRRIVQAATGFHSDDMETDLPKALREYVARMGRIDRIKVIDDGKLHYKTVERFLKKNRVGLMVFDQLWKMKGFGPVSADSLTTIFNWGREICKEHAALMAVHQAGHEADNKKWIEMGELYYGKTGPQGEADCIITMGRLTDRGNSRYIYVPKNKLLTPGNRAMRNGRYEVTIDPDRARFIES